MELEARKVNIEDETGIRMGMQFEVKIVFMYKKIGW